MFSQIFTDLEYTYDKKNKTTFLMKVLKKISLKEKLEEVYKQMLYKNYY